MDAMKRVTDLFVEGTEYYVGDDANGPVVFWINKLNPYQTEEARRDGGSARSQRMARLADPEDLETKGIIAELSLWTDENLAEQCLAQRSDELYLDAFNDLDTDEGMKDLRERVERMPQLLGDSNASEEDQRVKDTIEDQENWFTALHEAMEKKNREALSDLKAQPREKLEASFLERWRQRHTLDVFMEEKQATTLWYAIRQCKAKRAGQGPDGKPLWGHGECDHSQRWLSERKLVKDLPGEMIEKVIGLLESVTVTPLVAGNSDAPTSSSVSSEPSKAPEAVSNLSSQDETPPVAPTT